MLPMQAIIGFVATERFAFGIIDRILRREQGFCMVLTRITQAFVQPVRPFNLSFLKQQPKPFGYSLPTVVFMILDG